MTTPDPTAGDLEGATKTHDERHASWAELFFDLVVVAGIGLFSHLLHHPSAPVLALAAIGFGAFWTCWVAFTLYGNAAAERTRTNRLIQGMFGMAVMAAAVPGLAESLTGHSDSDGHRSVHVLVFTIAYILTRLRGAGAWRRGEILTDWPVAQQVSGILPWLASIWAPTSYTLWLWGLGLLIDVLVLLLLSGDDLLRQAEERLERIRRRELEHPNKHRQAHRNRRPAPAEPQISTVALQPGHLAERLGLFVIIVLGEGVIQAVNSAAEAEWNWALLGTGAAALSLLTGLWGLSVLHGYAGVPLLQPGQLSARTGIAFHGVVCAMLAVVATAVGMIVDNTSTAPESSARWLLCTGLAGYFALGLLASVLSRRLVWWRLLLWVVTGVVVPLALAVLGGDLSGVALAWYAAAVVSAHAWLGRIRPVGR